jgi:Cu-processing system ATP-binding protein
VIAFDRFTKTFNGRRAVDALTLTVTPGTIVALLGPNGSGKTTTLKAAAGLVAPTAGEVRLGEPGRSAADPEARRICSFLPQRASFPDSLTAREVIEFYRQLRGAPAEAADRALAFAALNGSESVPVGAYSGGMVQRLGLAVAMLPEASVLLLDEPTAALDPDGLCALYGLLEQRRRSGAAILFSSHQLGDVERLADGVAVLSEGRLLAVCSEREIAARLANRGVMRVRLQARRADLLERVRALAPGAVWFHDELIVPGPAALRPRILDAIRAEGAEILDLTAQDGRLDDFYKELVEGPR